MKARFILGIVTALLLSVGLSGQTTLELYSTDPFVLLRVRESLQNHKSPFQLAYKRLLRDAEKSLDTEMMSVVSKEKIPPSGNKHDYMSMGRYWWPDATKPDGLPYIRRDGETNPEIAQFKDHENLTLMASASSTLGLAYFFSGKEEYAQHAARLVRTWFLDSATAMSPHLQYAQAIPGRSEGRGTGILDGRHFALVIDAVGLIRGSASWSDEDQMRLKAWFSTYLVWLTENVNGKDEASAKNNHGTWYDAQVVAVALFAGRSDLAQKIVGQAPARRIFSQIEPDGRQPLELARTRPWNYSVFNLEAYARLAMQARRLNVDLTSAKDAEGRGLRAAVDYLIPFAMKSSSWTYADLDGVHPAALVPVLMWAYTVWKDSTYLGAARTIGGAGFQETRHLLLTGIVVE